MPSTGSYSIRTTLPSGATITCQATSMFPLLSNGGHLAASSMLILGVQVIGIKGREQKGRTRQCCKSKLSIACFPRPTMQEKKKKKRRNGKQVKSSSSHSLVSASVENSQLFSLLGELSRGKDATPFCGGPTAGRDQVKFMLGASACVGRVRGTRKRAQNSSHSNASVHTRWSFVQGVPSFQYLVPDPQ